MLNPSLLWLIAGSILCLIELFVPVAFMAFMMGISAVCVALISLIIPQFSLQVILWLILSSLFIWLSRRLIPKKSKASHTIDDATEGETLTEILPGKTGRVLYEGNSWSAKCDDENLTILPKQKVYIVRRKGNILIVIPENFVH